MRKGKTKKKLTITSVDMGMWERIHEGRLERLTV